MTETELKDFLDSFVDEPERNFVVVYSPRKTRRRRGSYNAGLRRIKIFTKALPQPIDLIATGLHELGHHLSDERYGAELMNTWRETKRFPIHGRIFKATLDQLLETFNATHAERYQGILVREKGEARTAPKFVEFASGITSAEDMIADYRAVTKLLDAIFGRRRKKSSTKNVPATVPTTDVDGAELPIKKDYP